MKDGLPPDWPHKNEKGKAWAEEEKNLLIEALEAAPQGILPKKLIGIYRAEKSRQFPNPATSGVATDGTLEGFVVIYDSAFEKNQNLARIVIHEMSHQIYVELSDDDQGSYHTVTNWFVEKDPKTEQTKGLAARLTGFVLDDGRDSPGEDFANNVEFFLFEPKKLQEVTPHAHRWISEHFGDKFRLEA